MFETKRLEIDSNVARKLEIFSENNTLDADDLEILKERLIAKESKKIALSDIDPNLIAKRPDKARKEMREIAPDIELSQEIEMMVFLLCILMLNSQKNSVQLTDEKMGRYCRQLVKFLQ